MAGASETSRKRVYVEPEGGEEIIDSKRPRFTGDESMKKLALKFIWTAATGIHDAFTTLPTEAWKCLNVSCQVSNILFTIHTILRQRGMGYTGNAENKSTTSTFKITHLSQEYTATREVLTKVVQDAANELALSYENKGKAGVKWIGTVGPYLDFFCGFHYRLQELRVGHGGFTVAKKPDGTEEQVPLSSYGLGPQHHILCEGVTFPPEKRSSMAQSVGSMTALICYMRAPEKFKKKWAASCKNAMLHLPYIDDLLKTVTGKKARDVRALINIVANTLLITGSRRSHRMFFPILPFCHLMSKEAEIKKTPVGGKDAWGMADEDLLSKLDFSGKGAFSLYKRFSDKKKTWSLQGNFTDSVAAQVVYHCIFGTYKEDLGLLQVITNQANWYQRAQMGNCFQGMGKWESAVKFDPVVQRAYSKLSNANLTGMLASQSSQVSCSPVFSGKRAIHFGEDFFTALGKTYEGAGQITTIDSLTAQASRILGNCIKEIRQGQGTIDVGTVLWKSMDGVSFDKDGDAVTISYTPTNKFFLGQSK